MPIQRTKGEKVFSVFNYAFLTVVSLLFVIPFLTVLSTSFVGEEEWARRGAYILVPETFDFTAYRLLLGSSNLLYTGALTSVLRVTIGTFLNLVFTATLAYVLGKRRLPGRIALTLFVFITMVFNGGLIPRYVLIDSIGLTNTFWAMVIPFLVNPWYMLIMRNFFMNIPESLEEAAIIDGALPWQRLIRIVLPLSLPSIATIGLFYAVFHWNEWFYAFLFVNIQERLPLQVVLRNILEAGVQEDTEIVTIEKMPPAQSVKTAMIILTVTPILCVYPFIQRYFVKGALIGSIKG